MWSRSALRFTKRSSIHVRWSRHIQSAASYLHNPGSEPLHYGNLGDVIAQTVDKYPDRIAVKSIHENVTITYEQLLKQADSLGCVLRAQGLEKGDRLGIWSHNNVAWIVAIVAAARAGLISVLINPVYEKNELSFCLKKTQIKSLLIGQTLPNRNYYNALTGLLPELRNSKPGLWKSKEFPDMTSVISAGTEILPGTIPYDSLTTGSGSQISQYSSDIKWDEGCIIHFTSGTTAHKDPTTGHGLSYNGRVFGLLYHAEQACEPKAALDSHLGVVNNTYFIGKRNTFHEEPHNICVQVPLFHALGSIVTVLASIQHGSRLTLAAPTYNIDANVNTLLKEQCTTVIGTPTMFVDMLSKVKKTGEVPSKMRMALAAGAPCSPQLIRDMQKYLNAESVKCLYGMTETTASVFQSIPGDSIDMVANTVGYIQDHVEAKVVDANGDMVPFGSSGELVVRGYNIMIKYWDEPEKTRKALSDDGWLKTGDEFIINKDGYGRIVGRLKDIIVRGGENIAPKEIEDLLNTHPDIVESQVVGVADERLGEELCAVLRLREGANVTLDNVRSFCAGHIAKFKIPRILKVTKEFPKTASGKIQKYRLKEFIESGKL